MNKRKYRYINGCSGVISLFLALLMLPFVSIGGSLINAARMNSAVAIFDEALCNASNSTLGTYDEFLRKRFGLLAMKQTVDNESISREDVQNIIRDTFDFYMEKNLKALSNTYYSYENSTQGVYSLADKDVLLSEILEFSKYTVPINMVNDGLNIDSFLEAIQEKFLVVDYLDLFSSGLSVADSLDSMAETLEDLKSEVVETQKFRDVYTSAYNVFSERVSEYINIRTEKNEVLSDLQEKINDKQEEINQIPDFVDDGTVESQNYSSQKAQLEAEKSQLQVEKGSKENEYNNKLAQIDIEGARIAYINAIEELQEKISSTLEGLNKLRDCIGEVKEDFTETVEKTTQTAMKTVKANEEKRINNLENKIKSENLTEEEKNNVSSEINELKKSVEKIDEDLEDDRVNDALGETISGIENDINVLISQEQVKRYEEIYKELGKVKYKVQQYNTSNIQNIDASFFYNIQDLFTYDQIIEIENSVLNELINESSWGILKSLTGFIDALFSLQFFCDASLCANIDQEYYKDTYGGLPSKKDRTVYVLESGNEEDAQKSKQYRDMINSYEIVEMKDRFNDGIMGQVANIGNDLSCMNTVLEEMSPEKCTELKGFTSLLRSIQGFFDKIVEGIKTIITALTNLVTNLYDRFLLSGYVVYMTSNRLTSSDDTTLTGENFNVRGQVKPQGNSSSLIVSGFSDLFSTSTDTGVREKAFYGAEMEYLLHGSMSEVKNQITTFGWIFLLRQVANIPTILRNDQVRLMAHAVGAFGPVVYILYVLLEPLADTLLIVNGVDTKLFKFDLYLAPAGIDDFIKKLTEIKVSEDKQDSFNKTKSEFLSKKMKLNETTADAMATYTGEVTGIYDMQYKTYLYILSLFTSTDDLLNRMADIIEMESVVNLENNVIGMNDLFDLDYSYTYLRASASFSTTEFITLSDKDYFSKERIIYKSY